MNLLLKKFWLLLMCFAAIIVSGCDVDASVGVSVESDGSGYVEFVALVAGSNLDSIFDLEDGLSASVQDLQEAGWEVFPVEVVDSGRQVSGRKQFGNPQQFTDVLEELSGPAGLFDSFELLRRQSFGNLGYELSGVVDPTDGLENFSDEALGSVLGKSLSEFAADNEFDASNLNLELTIRLPGEIVDNSSLTPLQNSETDRGSRTFLIDLDSDQPGVVDLTSADVSIGAQVLRGVAVLSGLAAVLVLISVGLSYLAGRNKPKNSKAVKGLKAVTKDVKALAGSHVKAKLANGSADDEDTQDSQDQRLYGVVAFDGMGVIYREEENLKNLLIPFVREQGGHLPDDEILAKAIEMTQGRRSAAELWKSVGLDDDPAELTDKYLATLTLSPGVVKYMLGLRDKGIKVACLTNDSFEWASILRKKHSLNGLVDIWVISGEIGLRKPSHGAFEALRRRCSEPTERILLIDDELEVLDQARKFGFGTAWYSKEPLPDGSPHDLFKGFPSEKSVTEE